MTNLIKPMLGMVGLTAGVWSFMYYKRLSYITKHKIEPATIDNPDKLSTLLPDDINLPSYNLKNLFEMPVIFYALCLAGEILMAQDKIAPDTSNSLCWLAWGYVILRALHSIVQCTYNKVAHRFLAYLLSCFVLWAIAVKIAMVAWA